MWFCLFKSICGINIMVGVFVTFRVFCLIGRKYIVLRPQPFENSILWFRWNPEFLNIGPRNSNNLLKWLDLISVCCRILSSLTAALLAPCPRRLSTSRTGTPPPMRSSDPPNPPELTMFCVYLTSACGLGELLQHIKFYKQVWKYVCIV